MKTYNTIYLCFIIFFSFFILINCEDDEDENIFPGSALVHNEITCESCNLVVQYIKREFTNLHFEEAFLKIKLLKDNPREFLENFGDYGGNRERNLIYILNLFANKFSPEFFINILTETAEAFCEMESSCNMEALRDIPNENTCNEQCPSSCCTTYNVCVCGSLNKREIIRYDHFLIDVLAEDSYLYVITEEDLKDAQTLSLQLKKEKAALQREGKLTSASLKELQKKYEPKYMSKLVKIFSENLPKDNEEIEKENEEELLVDII